MPPSLYLTRNPPRSRSQLIPVPLTGMDILEKGFPDGVLQWPHVFGGGKVLIGQVGLVDLSLQPAKER